MNLSTLPNTNERLEEFHCLVVDSDVLKTGKL
jgi:hypothetical protein